MPVVEEKIPSPKAVPTKVSTQTSEPDQDEALAVVVEKLELHDKRLNSLREPFEALLNRCNNLDERLHEVEGVVTQIETGKAPAVTEIHYDGLMPKDIFIAVLVGVVQGSIAQYPQVMNSKPALRSAHIANAVDIASECVAAAVQRLPKLNKR